MFTRNSRLENVRNIIVICAIYLICGYLIFGSLSWAGALTRISGSDHDPQELVRALKMGEVTPANIRLMLERGETDFSDISLLSQAIDILSREPSDSISLDLPHLMETYGGLVAAHSREISNGEFDLKFAETNVNGDSFFGSSVASAGDVNGDGFDDFIVGASDYSNAKGRVYIYYGGLEPHLNLTYKANITLNGENEGDYFGISIASAGDVNNDGYDDVIIGANWYNSSTGRAYLYYGGARMDNKPDVVFDGERASSFFGGSVSAAGDFNNDGFDDVIIGAYMYNSYTGRVYIYYGGRSMDNIFDAFFKGEEMSSRFGFSISTAGDVNNDKYDDIVIGARGYNKTGRVYIYYGGSSPDRKPDIFLDVEDENTYFGHSVSTAGDVNNDGFDDVIVGAYRYDGYTGKSYIYHGGKSMDHTPDAVFKGEEQNSWFGSIVSTAGDLNNDGFDDVVVGAYRYNDHTGKSYIYFGSKKMDSTPSIILKGEAKDNYFSQSISGSIDINNDGFDDVIVGARGYKKHAGRAYVYYGGKKMDHIYDMTFDGEGKENRFAYSVSTAGDFNSDGYDDVIVGAEGFNNKTGRAYLYYGGVSMDHTADLLLNGEEKNNRFGASVSNAGDVNRDGFDDVIVGAYGYKNKTGRAYIYYGGSTPDDQADLTLDGEEKNNLFGKSVSRAGDVNRDGFDDVVVGAEGYREKTGRVYIYYGGRSIQDTINVAFLGIDNAVDIIFEGEQVADRFGVSVSTAGDINNDGFDDVIVGACGYKSKTGRAYIYYGGRNMNGAVNATFDGEHPADRFGFSVSTAGDVNNDRYHDVIVGAYGHENKTGRAYIYYGGRTMGDSADVTFDGEKIEGQFGVSASTAGDVNYDGFSDVVIGAAYGNGTERAYLYYGGMAMDDTVDVIFDGEVTKSHFGCSVSIAGDVNNDSFDDLIIGADSRSTNGAAYLYYGSIDRPSEFSKDITNISVDEDADHTAIDLKDFFKNFEGVDDSSCTVWRNSNPNLFASLEVINGKFIIDYAPNTSGNAVIVIRVVESDESLTEKSFTVTVAEVNDIPFATDLAIDGALNIGYPLTAKYYYNDYEGDPEGFSLFQWYRADDAQGAGSQPVPGAYGQIYSLTAEDEGHYFRYEVTPISQIGVLVGDTVQSGWVGPIMSSTVTIRLPGGWSQSASDVRYFDPVRLNVDPFGNVSHNAAGDSTISNQNNANKMLLINFR